MGVGADVGGGGDDGGGVDAGRVGGGLVEEFDGEGEGEVGILDAEGGGGDPGKSGSTRTAVARVVRARAAYLGLETKVRSPGSAVSMPATRVFGGGVAVEGGVEVLG